MAISSSQEQIPFRTLREVSAAAFTASFVSILLNPFDVVKVKLQTQNQRGANQQHLKKLSTTASPQQGKLYCNSLDCFVKSTRENGFVRGLLFPGLTASVLRDILNGGIRVGLYPYALAHFGGGRSDESKVAAACLTGAVGAAVANPFDIIKIRFQAEAGRLGAVGSSETSVKAGASSGVDNIIMRGGAPNNMGAAPSKNLLVRHPQFVYENGLYVGSHPTYLSTSEAFGDLLKTRGAALRGVLPNVFRSAVVTTAQILTYDKAKTYFKREFNMENDIRLFASAGFASGFVASLVAAPVDLVKTRVMSDRRDMKLLGQPQAGFLYRSSFNCLRVSAGRDGLLALYRGWLPSYLRLGPHFTLAWPLLEMVRTRIFGLDYF